MNLKISTDLLFFPEWGNIQCIPGELNDWNSIFEVSNVIFFFEDKSEKRWSTQNFDASNTTFKWICDMKVINNPIKTETWSLKMKV